MPALSDTADLGSTVIRESAGKGLKPFQFSSGSKLSLGFVRFALIIRRDSILVASMLQLVDEWPHIKGELTISECKRVRCDRVVTDVSGLGYVCPRFVSDGLRLVSGFSGDVDSDDCTEISAQLLLMQRSISGMGAHLSPHDPGAYPDGPAEYRDHRPR